MAHIILPSRRMVQPSGPVQLRPEFEKSAVWLFNGHYGNDKAVTTLGSFRATIEKSFPTADASMLAGSVGRFGIRDEAGSNFVGSGFDLAAYKTYIQPTSQAAILVVFTHIYVASISAQVWFSSHNRYNNQYGYRFDIPTGTNNLRWWTGNAAWTWNVTATDVLTTGTRYAAMGMSMPLAGQKDMSAWLGGRRVAHDNSLADFTITYSGTPSDPTILGARYDSAAFSLGTTPIGPVEMIAQFGSGLSYGLAQSLTIDPYQIFLPDRRRRIFLPSVASAGQTVAVGQVTETDLAQAITRSKAKLVGQTTETDLAQAISRLKRAALGQVTETDTAQAITAAKRATLGQVTETDLAQAIAPASANQVVQAAETDLAQSVGRLKTLALGQTTETETAQAIARAKAKQLGQTTEIDTAQAVAHVKAKLLGQVTETDLAQTVTPSVPNQLGQATETDTAQAVTHAKAKQLGQVTETDAAQSVSRLKTATVNLALEIDVGQPITWAPKVRILGQVLETDLAQPIAGALASTVLPQGKLFTVGARTGFVVGPRSGFRVDQ